MFLNDTPSSTQAIPTIPPSSQGQREGRCCTGLCIDELGNSRCAIISCLLEQMAARPVTLLTLKCHQLNTIPLHVTLCLHNSHHPSAWHSALAVQHSCKLGNRRQAVEVAKLGKGDIVNGVVLVGRKPQFTVVAHTKVRACSFQCMA